MKKIFAFLLLGLTVAFASCGDEKTETGTDWFLTPVAEVNGTTVGLSCQTRFGEGVLENTSVGFPMLPLSTIKSARLPMWRVPRLTAPALPPR